MHSKLVLAALLVLPSFAAAQADTAQLDPSSLMIERLPAPAQPAVQAPAAQEQGKPIITIKRIINLAFKIWDIIEKNRPVVNITTDYANAVPEGLDHWTDLTGWQGPESKLYLFTAKNKAGMVVVKAVYKVHYVWNGSYYGKGRFLTGVTIEPQSIETSWGTNLDVTAEVPDAAVGNAGTDEDPVSVMELRLKWKVKTFLQNTEQKASYRVYGDGRLEELGPLFERARDAKNAAGIEAVKKSLENSRFN